MSRIYIDCNAALRRGGKEPLRIQRGIRIGLNPGYRRRLWLLVLCDTQNGYCLAMAFRRWIISSEGGGVNEASSSLAFFERGCLTILAVAGNVVSCELTDGVITWTTLGFI